MQAQFLKLSQLLRERPLVMGVLNATPDSFSDGGRWLDPERALRHAKELFDEGADLVDLGGESTRPGAPAVSLQEELDRVLPIAEGLAGRPWSIDTQKAEVARQAIAAGACLVNDVSALSADAAMAPVLAQSDVGLCLMHRLDPPAQARWSPEEQSHYGQEGVAEAVRKFLAERLQMAVKAGISLDRIWVDPGLGFGKTVSDNLALLKALPALGVPVLLGPSRKSFIGAVLGGLPVEERLEGTLAACVAGVLNGARILRVHDVRPAVRAARMAQAVLNA